MNRLDECFRAARRQRRKVLIAFTMAGDPSLAATERLLRVFNGTGVDIIELGMPFSDPLADGPTLQAAAQRALRAGTTLQGVLRLVQRFRRQSSRPVVILSYLNPIMRFGPSFFQAAHRAGVDGVVIPDLPVEEARNVRRVARRAGVSLIVLAAPTSSVARLRAIARAGQGFIYYVSVTGTTGARRQLPREVTHGVQRLKRLTRVPVCVGFGIASPHEAKRMARVADGIIVGSAIVSRWARTHSTRAVGAFVRSLRRALDA